MVTVKEIGVFKPDFRSNQYCKTDFDYKKENRQLWLVEVIPISSKMIGSSNYSTDHEVISYYVFRVNNGINKGKSYMANEDYLVVFEIHVYDWYKPEETVLLELREALFDKYPIIDCQSVLDACKVRNIYSGYYKEKLSI
jgi:hypothetical protein